MPPRTRRAAGAAAAGAATVATPATVTTPASGAADGTANGASNGSADIAPAPTKAKAKATGGRKRSAAPTVPPQDTQDTQDTQDSPPRKKAKAEAKAEAVFGEAQVAKPEIKVPLDENIDDSLTSYEVYIDEDGIIHDASLNQTHASHNNNKFYRVQLLKNVHGDYKTWTRWGRVGERGQKAILGDGTLASALSNFNKKFKDKSGLAWEKRGEKPKAGKYTFIERSYAPDSDDEGDDDDDGAGDEASAGDKVKQEEAPESKLAPAVQSLMELIFNQQYFAATMTELNYDVKKLPLGKLSKNTILRGFQALKDLAALMDDPASAQTHYGTAYGPAMEELSNTYFSLIPHAFGRNRPPVIQHHDMLKKEIELLESLSDMKDASGILKNEKKDAERLNLLDRQFQGLGLEEMTPLARDSAEFGELKAYLMGTRGKTHNTNYEVSDIFRIERQGERARFESSPFAGPPRDRRLLWHGSRCTNFGGILSQGLRIAPPEAPVSGYMFGKGVYLADMSSKSANYCVPYISNGHALLLLCEAELGDPMQILQHASSSAGDTAKAKGMLSTWGQGMTGPSQWKDAGCVHPSLQGVKMPDTTVKPSDTNVLNAYLQYNEFIAYDVAQIRLRYLLRVRM